MNFGGSRRILWLVQKLPDIEPDRWKLGEIGGKTGIFNVLSLTSIEGKGKRQQNGEEGNHLLRQILEKRWWVGHLLLPRFQEELVPRTGWGGGAMEESWRWPSVALHTSHPSPTSCSTPRFNFLMMLMDDTKPKNIKLWDLFQTGCSQFPLLFWGVRFKEFGFHEMGSSRRKYSPQMRYCMV